MSISAKHAYRFGYLKSEEWKTVRIEALAREQGKCQVCGEESIYNDAHHIWYPESIYDTREFHLAILCRPCHDFVHAMLPECKTNDENKGRQHWLKFRNAVIAWRAEKLSLFNSQDGMLVTSPTIVAEQVNKLKQFVYSKSLRGGNVEISKAEIGEALGKFSRALTLNKN